MKKLSELNQSRFNQNNLKHLIKKGMQIGVLGAALGAGTLMTGCPTPLDPIPDPEEPIVKPVEQDDEKYNKPYDKKLGNGNYVVHNFVGEYDFDLHNFDLLAVDLEKDLNHYLDKGQDYIEDCAKDFSQSLKGRPAAQEYLKNINQIVDANQHMYIDDKIDQYSVDKASNVFINATRDYCNDIIKNLNNTKERYTFYLCYEALSSESAFFGLGHERDNHYSTHYKHIQKIEETWNYSWNKNPDFDIEQDILNNNCQAITQTMDNLLGIAVSNMNQKNNLDLQVNDLRQVVNISLLPNAIMAVDDFNHNFSHKKCQYFNNIVQTMKDTSNLLRQEELATNQGMTR